MKGGGKKKEKREEREIWNRAIFCTPFTSCSHTLHSIPLYSSHIDTDRVQKSGCHFT